MIIVCEHCGKKVDKPSKKARFCNRSCSNAWQHAYGKRRNYMNDKSTYEWWIEKYGEEGAERKHREFIEKMSNVTSGVNNPMFGRNDQTSGLKRLAKERTGKTWEEIYGVEQAQKMHAHASKVFSGKGNPAYGKVYKNGGKSVKGWYRGIYFRSLFEYSYLKHLEKIGFDVTDEHQVIPEGLRIEYGDQRTYVVDFVLPEQNLVIEIKPSYAVNSDNNRLKFAAAYEYCQKRGQEFRIVTENDMTIVSFSEADKDKNLQWNEATLEYFKSKK